MNRLVEFLKILAICVPFLGAGAILYGALYVYYYYFEFGFSIYRYMVFSEIIVFFVRDIPIIFGMFMSTFVVFLIFDLIVKYTIKKAKNIAIKRNYQETNGMFVFRFALSYGFPISLLFFSLLVFSDFVQGRHPDSITIRVIFFYGFLFPMAMFVFPDRRLVFTGVVSVLFVTVPQIYAKRESVRIKKGISAGMVFSIKNTPIRSDSIDYYIGKTEKYVFFYRSKHKATIIYKVEDIDYFIIPNKKR